MKILVVDDQAKNLMDAFNCLTAAGHEVVLACCARHAADMMQCFLGIEGVISDVFMPYDSPRQDRLSDLFADTSICEEYPPLEGEETDLFYVLHPYFQVEYLIAKYKIGNEDASQPVGLLVAARTHEQGLPVVLCTSIARHGQKVKWIENMPHGMFDDIIGCSSEGKKDWSRALASLVKILKEKEKEKI